VQVVGAMSFQGTVKSFNPVKCFGFIDFQGTDVFVHMKDCVGGVPKQGDAVYFDVQESQKKPGTKNAINVQGGSGAQKGVMGNGSCQGIVKSFNPMKGFGFIEYMGTDVFVHSNDCQGGLPKQGETVAFDIEDSPSKPGTKKASNVTGGSGDLNEGKGGGKGYDGYGAMWGGKGGWAPAYDPYGGAGWGKGQGKGWDQGKGWGKGKGW